MSNFKTISVTEIRMSVNTFDSILTKVMLLQLQKLETENGFLLLKKVTSSMVFEIKPWNLIRCISMQNLKAILAVNEI